MPVDPEYNPNELTVTVTFTNHAQVTPLHLKAAIEQTLGFIADEIAGEIFIVEGHEPTGVILGNG